MRFSIFRCACPKELPKKKRGPLNKSTSIIAPASGPRWSSRRRSGPYAASRTLNAPDSTRTHPRKEPNARHSRAFPPTEMQKKRPSVTEKVQLSLEADRPLEEQRRQKKKTFE